MTSRAVTRVRDRFARSKLEDCHLRPPILSPIPISATNLTVPFADVKDLNVVFRSIVEQECRLLCEIPLETILDACFLTYFRHIFLSFFHSSQKPYAELRNLDIISFHEKSFNPSRRVMETICSHLSTQQHEEYVIHVLYRLLKLNRELLQTDPKNKRKVSSKIYCEVSKTLASNGLEKSAVSLFIQNMYFSFASSTLVQLIKYCDDREIFESCIEFSGWTIAVLYSLQRNQPQLRPTFEFVLGKCPISKILKGHVQNNMLCRKSSAGSSFTGTGYCLA